MLQTPQLLAKLPKSFNSEDIGPLAADVYALVAGKKRKRSELVVAVSGEAINLYDVCSHQTKDVCGQDSLMLSRSMPLDWPQVILSRLKPRSLVRHILSA